MPWFFAAVVVVCAIAFPKFRKLLVATAALLTLVIVALVLNSQSEDRASRSRIPLNEVELVGVTLQNAAFGHDYTLQGRVRNRSPKYTLSDFTIKVTLEDCLTDTNCDVIYEATRSPLVGPVPPSQVRDFEITGVGERDQRFKGKLRWSYSLTEVRGTK